LPEDIALLLSEEEQELLSDYAVVVRYPMEDEPVAKDDAETALAIAKRVREAARRILPDIE
jgi:HEPN domain-containing protein